MVRNFWWKSISRSLRELEREREREKDATLRPGSHRRRAPTGSVKDATLWPGSHRRRASIGSVKDTRRIHEYILFNWQRITASANFQVSASEIRCLRFEIRVSSFEIRYLIAFHRCRTMLNQRSGLRWCAFRLIGCNYVGRCIVVTNVQQHYIHTYVDMTGQYKFLGMGSTDSEVDGFGSSMLFDGM